MGNFCGIKKRTEETGEESENNVHRWWWFRFHTKQPRRSDTDPTVLSTTYLRDHVHPTCKYRYGTLVVVPIAVVVVCFIKKINGRPKKILHVSSNSILWDDNNDNNDIVKIMI